MKLYSEILSAFAYFSSRGPEDLLPAYYRIGLGILPLRVAELRNINVIFQGTLD